MTISLMRRFGVTVREQRTGGDEASDGLWEYHIDNAHGFENPPEVEVEADASSASDSPTAHNHSRLFIQNSVKVRSHILAAASVVLDAVGCKTSRSVESFLFQPKSRPNTRCVETRTNFHSHHHHYKYGLSRPPHCCIVLRSPRIQLCSKHFGTQIIDRKNFRKFPFSLTELICSIPRNGQHPVDFMHSPQLRGINRFVPRPFS